MFKAYTFILEPAGLPHYSTDAELRAIFFMGEKVARSKLEDFALKQAKVYGSKPHLFLLNLVHLLDKAGEYSLRVPNGQRDGAYARVDRERQKRDCNRPVDAKRLKI